MTEPGADGGDARALPGVERELRTPRAGAVAGLAFTVLFVGSVLLLRKQPPQGASAAEIEAWYLRGNVRDLALVGIYLAPFAGIAFLWFIAVIRSRIGEREDRFFATVFLGSGLVFVAMMFGATAAAIAPVATVRFQRAPVPGPDAFALARALAYSFLYIYAVRAGAVFMIVVSTIGLRTGTLPRWLAVTGYVVALVLLFGVSFFRLSVLLFPAWVAAVSLVILITAQVSSERRARARKEGSG
jgi:hypothetical protein